MQGLAVTVLLGAAVLLAGVVAPRLRIAEPLVLVLIGIVLGFVPALRAIELPPETVLLLFLPVLLFWESLTTSLRSIRRDFRGLVLLSTLLPVASAFTAAGVATALGLAWSAALILGAAVAPPDATAASALGRSLPQRNFMLLKAESLTNDGTALVVYAVAVAAASGTRYSPLDITGMVLLSYVGGAAAGAVVAGAAFLVMRRLRTPLTINVALLVAAFGAYLLAEAIGASGVLAVVVAGLALAFVSGRITNARSRQQTESAFPLGTYLLNGALFVLIGLEVQTVVRAIEPAQIGRLLVIVVAVWLLLMVVRFVFQVAAVTVIRLLDRRPSQRGRRMPHRARLVSAVAGFRGAVSLAIALSVPDGIAGRDEIVFVTAGVVVLTLLVQGPLLPVVVRWAKLPADTSGQRELALAEHAVVEAAVAAIPQLARTHGIDDQVRNRIQREADESLALIGRVPSTDDDGPDAAVQRHGDAVLLRLAVLDRKREVLARLRRGGTIDDGVARQLQTRFDVEELRLSPAERED